MTPKEQYEARKAARLKARDEAAARNNFNEHKTPSDEEALLLMERAVDALESIATSLVHLSSKGV